MGSFLIQAGRDMNEGTTVCEWIDVHWNVDTHIPRKDIDRALRYPIDSGRCLILSLDIEHELEEADRLQQFGADAGSARLRHTPDLDRLAEAWSVDSETGRTLGQDGSAESQPASKTQRQHSDQALSRHLMIPPNTSCTPLRYKRFQDCWRS